MPVTNLSVGDASPSMTSGGAREADANLLPETAAPKTGPPRAWVLIADWANVLAGIVLMCAFFEGALINSVKMGSLLEEIAPGVFIPTDSALSWLQFFFSLEGALYAIAEFFMVGIMAATPPEFGGGSKGCMQFAILCVGGVFFGLSGLVYPPCITNITYVFRNEACTSAAVKGTPYVWNAMAHFGITCFMVGTTIGFSGLLKAPKDKLVSPFWGSFMYFFGAWTIGIFKFWGPVLCGGFDSNQNFPHFDDSAPAVAWSATWWLALIGAAGLTLGAVIFALLDGSFKCA